MAARKATAKKTTAKKAPAKKAPEKKAAASKPAPKKLTAVKERYSKTQLLTHLSETTELNRKQVSAVLDELSNVVEAHVSKKGCGEFVMPGLFKDGPESSSAVANNQCMSLISASTVRMTLK